MKGHSAVVATWQNAAVPECVSLRYFPKCRFTGLATLAFCLLISAVCIRAGAQSFSIDWYKIASGGGACTNSQFIMNGTFGQYDAGSPVTNGNFSFTGGFWALSPVQLIADGGFEAGNFSGWTQSGNTSGISVSPNSAYVHSGRYGAQLGSTGSLGYLSQTLSTSMGASYQLSLWLNSNGSVPNEFLIYWGGNTIFDEVNIPAMGWTNLQFSVVATGTNTVLKFGFRDDSGHLGLDDVSVVPASVTLPTNMFLPVYRVTQAGATFPQVTALANSLNIPTNMLVWSNGVLSFIDPTNFMAIPSVPITDTNTAAISNLLAGTRNPNPAIPIKVQALDFATLTNLPVFDADEALDLTSNALAAAGLTPQFGTPLVGHTGLIAFMTNADSTVTSVNQYLDTLVSYQFSLPGVGTNRYPLIGVGAHVQESYGPTGNVTRLLYAVPQLTAGQLVQIISPTEASNRVAALFPTNTQISMGLVYQVPPFSPPPSLSGCSNCPPSTWPTNIIPYYACSGTVTMTNPLTGSNTTVTTETQMMPATDDTNYVPSINLSASQVGTQIVASVSANGGSPPYTYIWSGSNPSVSSDNSASIYYTPMTRVLPPPLAIAFASNNTVNVLWPNSTGFQLESTTNLSAPNWRQVSNPVHTNAGPNGFNLVIIPATGNLFLRLRLASQTVPVNETVGVTVTDANRVSIHANQTLAVQAQPVPLPVGPADPPSFATESPFANSPYDNAGFSSDTAAWRNTMLNSAFGGVENYYHMGLFSNPGNFIGLPPEAEFWPISSGSPGGIIPTIISPSSGPPGSTGNLLCDCVDVPNVGINTANLVMYFGHGNSGEFTFTWPGGLPTAPNTSQFIFSDFVFFGQGPDFFGDYDASFLYEPSYAESVTYLFFFNGLFGGYWGNNPQAFQNFQDQNEHANGHYPPWPGALNWLGFDACHVLAFNNATRNSLPPSPPSGVVTNSFTDPDVWQRWGPALNGLHIMFGFHSYGEGGRGTAGAFANSMLTPNMTIMQAWFNAYAQTQDATVPKNAEGLPSGDPGGEPIVAAALGPFAAGGVSDQWDFYPGVNKSIPGVPDGSMGPSIAPNLVTGWWYVYCFQTSP